MQKQLSAINRKTFQKKQNLIETDTFSTSQKLTRCSSHW